jgi:very-short-patch-repair endonuclease
MSQSHKAFRQYEERLRQRQEFEKLQRGLQHSIAQQQALALQIAREQERRAAEQRQTEQRLQAEQQVREQREREEQQRKAEDTRRRDVLQLANQQRYVALLEARERAKERTIHAQRVWIGQDGYVYRSPAELLLYEEWVKDPVRASFIPLERQYPIGRRRADFADPLSKTVIEVDGWKYHGQYQSNFNNGYRRTQVIEEQGWTIKRVSAQQVFEDVQLTALHIYQYIERRRHEVR